MDQFIYKQQASNILENFNNKENKLAFILILSDIIRDVGLDKQKIIQELKSTNNSEMMAHISDLSIFHKQIFQSFVESSDERNKAFNNLIDYISTYDEKDGELTL